jgi:uncharacterized sodium:solute symporter family permease YidK
MRENAEQRTIQDELRRIGSQLGQIKILLAILIIVSPVGLYCIGKLMNNIPAVAVVAFWIAIALAVGYLLLLCIAKVTGTHKTLELKQDELTRILKKHGQQEDGKPA